MNVSIDFDKLSIHVLNGLGPANSNISHALQAMETPVTFEELFEQLLSDEAQMKILVHSTSPASTSAIALVTSPGPSSHRRSNNRGERYHSRSRQSWPLPDTPHNTNQLHLHCLYGIQIHQLGSRIVASSSVIKFMVYPGTLLNSAVIYPPRQLQLFYPPLPKLRSRPSLHLMPTL